MTYDPHPPPQAPATTAFTYGAPSRRSRRPLVGAAVAAAVIAAGAVGAVALSGGDEPPAKAVAPVAKPAAKKKPGLTTDRQLVLDVLKTAVIAQESYATEHDGVYSTRVAALEEEGFEPNPRVKVRVLRANRKGYCMAAAGAGRLVFYYDGGTGVLGRASCA